MENVALITGSSRGIGAATAALLAQNGWAVCINYLEQREKAESLAAALNALGFQAIAHQADVSDRAAVNAMVQRVEEELGPVGLLVNNAGVARQQQFQDIEPEYWQHIFSVNLGGCFNCTQAVLPNMLHEHEGCIVNISSIWGTHGASCETAYSATKHAIIGLTRSLAAELAPSNIRVNCITPGVIDTEMLSMAPPEARAMLEEETPIGRLGQPSDIAEAVFYLASPASSFLTGQVIAPNGGLII